MNKHNIVVVRNFKEVQPAILKDATDAISKNEALVYSRVVLPKDVRTDNKTSILIAGDDFAIIYGIARIINLITKKFNVSKYLVIDTILDLMEGFNDEI